MLAVFVALAALSRASGYAARLPTARRNLSPRSPRAGMRTCPQMSPVSTPAVSQARIVQQKEEIRRLESDLAVLHRTLKEEQRNYDSIVQVKGPTYRDTTQRSIIKALGWRITAGAITFASSYYFTRNLKLALKIVASDFLSKSGTMFIGERLFNKVKVGRSSGGESFGRSVIKALIWRAIAVVNTMMVSGFLSGSIGMAGKIASSDALFKTTLMVFYDQCWNRIDWGKELENVDGDGI
ncbi:hypothetical protein M885DRAFT_514927 [Pelagophyceae sp. CCMP2097]|nr:hypothetical protein M885DRAFT_514927 [Pelagophyceae sp. CCMP2097]